MEQYLEIKCPKILKQLETPNGERVLTDVHGTRVHMSPELVGRLYGPIDDNRILERVLEGLRGADLDEYQDLVRYNLKPTACTAFGSLLWALVLLGLSKFRIDEDFDPEEPQRRVVRAGFALLVAWGWKVKHLVVEDICAIYEEYDLIERADATHH